MAKITIGNQYDESKSTNQIVVSPGSNLEVAVGSQHDQSTREVSIQENATSRQRNLVEVGASDLWAKGSFFLVAFALVATVIGILAFKLAWYLVPISVVGTIVVLYLLALVLLPNGVLTEKGLLSVLQAYVRLAFTLSPEPKGKRQPAAEKISSNRNQAG